MDMVGGTVINGGRGLSVLYVKGYGVLVMSTLLIGWSVINSACVALYTIVI